MTARLRPRGERAASRMKARQRLPMLHSLPTLTAACPTPVDAKTSPSLRQRACRLEGHTDGHRMGAWNMRALRRICYFRTRASARSTPGAKTFLCHQSLCQQAPRHDKRLERYSGGHGLCMGASLRCLHLLEPQRFLVYETTLA
jgi:hypothetical protein